MGAVSLQPCLRRFQPPPLRPLADVDCVTFHSTSHPVPKTLAGPSVCALDRTTIPLTTCCRLLSNYMPCALDISTHCIGKTDPSVYLHMCT